MQRQAGRTKYDVADFAWAGVVIADSRAAINARVAGFSCAVAPQGIFYIPNLDDLTGTHGLERYISEGMLVHVTEYVFLTALHFAHRAFCAAAIRARAAARLHFTLQIGPAILAGAEVLGIFQSRRDSGLTDA